jgi:hypothetical protein
MVVAEVLVALVGVAFLVVNRKIDGAVERYLETQRLPSPPSGVVLDSETQYVVGAHDWGNVVFWSFVRKDEATQMFRRVRLRRLLFEARRDPAGVFEEWSELQRAGYNRLVDRDIRTALRARTAEASGTTKG